MDNNNKNVIEAVSELVNKLEGREQELVALKKLIQNLNDQKKDMEKQNEKLQNEKMELEKQIQLVVNILKPRPNDVNNEFDVNHLLQSSEELENMFSQASPSSTDTNN